jgi:hypothetical protein
MSNSTCIDATEKSVRIINRGFNNSLSGPRRSTGFRKSRSRRDHTEPIKRVFSPPLTPSCLPVVKTTVQNLNLECVRPQRAGIVIYTVHNGAVYFGFGLDAKTHDLTDFGGGIIYKHDLNVVRGALREFEEETLQIFEPIHPDAIQSCPVIYDSNNLIIFVHLNIDPDTACQAFNRKFEQIIQTISETPKKRYPEVCGITWINWEDFQRGINESGILFSRVQKFLQRAGDFSYLL